MRTIRPSSATAAVRSENLFELVAAFIVERRG